MRTPTVITAVAGVAAAFIAPMMAGAAGFGYTSADARFTGLQPGAIVEAHGPPFAADRDGESAKSYIRPVERKSVFAFDFTAEKRVAVRIRLDLNGAVPGRVLAVTGQGGKIVGAIMDNGDDIAFGDRRRNFRRTPWKGDNAFNTVTLLNEGGYAKLYINGEFFAAQRSPVGTGPATVKLGPLGLNDRLRWIRVRTGDAPAVTEVAGDD